MPRIFENIESSLLFIESDGDLLQAQSAAVDTTGPGVDKLRQLGDQTFFDLVTYCKGEQPRLQILQDPIPKLHLEMLYRQVQFLVEEKKWGSNSEELEAQK